jgi:hypothetical protein
MDFLEAMDALDELPAPPFADRPPADEVASWLLQARKP